MEKIINNAPFALVLVFLVIGFVLLIKGADFFVEGSSSVAKRLHVPSIIIGLTIVAMGTSLPETAVSVSASLAGNNELAVSNVVGSNIFNLMVVIGVCAILATVNVARETIRRDIPLSLICAGLLMLFGIIGLGDKTGMTLGHLDGVIFIVLFACYIIYMVRTAMKASKEGKKVEIEGGSDEEIKLVSVPVSILFIIGGAIAIAVGGDVTVDAASRIASDLGMSQTLIGLTIVSIGTSLPELVTSIVAARKNEVDMALGNAIGSNIFNILMVLGIASAISPISIITENIIDRCVLIVFTICAWIFAGTKKKIGRAALHDNICYLCGENCGVVASFFRLFELSDPDVDFYALSDQDDVWDEDKLSIACQKLEQMRKSKSPKKKKNDSQIRTFTTPLLYCCDAWNTDDALNPLSESMQTAGKELIPDFRNALIENIARGASIVFNQALMSYIRISMPQDIYMHDWWLYLVASCFGEVYYDSAAHYKYRQHAGN